MAEQLAAAVGQGTAPGHHRTAENFANSGHPRLMVLAFLNPDIAASVLSSHTRTHWSGESPLGLGEPIDP